MSDDMYQKIAWRPIETAPQDTLVWTTDGEWGVVAVLPSSDEGGDGGWRIYHASICHESEWEPTCWMPMKDNGGGMADYKTRQNKMNDPHYAGGVCRCRDPQEQFVRDELSDIRNRQKERHEGTDGD